MLPFFQEYLLILLVFVIRPGLPIFKSVNSEYSLLKDS